RRRVFRLVTEVAAREDGKCEAALREDLTQLAGLCAPAIEGARAQLDSFEPDGRDVVDRLGVVAAPRDRGVAHFDLRFCLKAETTETCSFRLQAENSGTCGFRL